MMTAARSLHIVLAAGGTGGHVFPAEAVAEALLNRGHKLTLITDRRGTAYGGALGRIETQRILAGGIAGLGVLGRVRGMVELTLGSFQAWGRLRRLKPDAVVGFGGYASIPTMMAALRLHLPTVVHEQNAVPGRANRVLAPRVSRYCTAQTNAVRPRGARQTHVGMPVRPAVLALRDAPYVPADPDGPFRLLVTGGSQGARVFSTLIPEALALLPDAQRARIRLTQQARPEDLDAARERLEALGVEATVSHFFTDLPDRLRDAHLVVCRSGASTVGELTVVGRPAVLVPYPFAIDDHQTANARGLNEAGAGWLMPQDHLTPESLADRLGRLMTEPGVLERAARCARDIGVPDAALRLAETIEDAAGLCSKTEEAAGFSSKTEDSP